MEPSKETGLAVQAPRGTTAMMTLRNLDVKQMLFMGELMFNAGMFSDLKSLAQAQVKIIAGQELGLAPMQAMNAFHIIHGRATMAANTMASKVLESGRYKYRVKEITDKICILEFSVLEGTKWVPLGLSPFTIEDAQKANTQNLQKFPRNMLFARALSNGVKWFCPDVFGMPVYVEGEVVDEEPVKLTEAEEADALEEAKTRINRTAKTKPPKAEEPAEAPVLAQESKPAPATPPKSAEPEKVAEQKPEENVDKTPIAGQVEGAPETYMNPAVPAQPEAEAMSFAEPDDDDLHTDNQRKRIMAMLNDLGFKNDMEKRQIVAGVLGLDQIVSFKTVTFGQAKKLIEALDNTDGAILRGMFIELANPAEDANAA